MDLIRIFSAKLVLEVFGGGGAIWGFSEAIGLRKPDTLWFWRPCALLFGFIFFIRWIRQIQDYREEMRLEKRGTLEEQVSMTAASMATENHDLAFERNVTTYT
jgi:hypothetical protein